MNLEATGIYGGIFTEGDGHIDPSSVTMAFAERAKGLGGTIRQQTEVVGLTPLPNGQWEVLTSTLQGQERTVADFVINAAGLWCASVDLGALKSNEDPVKSVETPRGIDENEPKRWRNWGGHGRWSTIRGSAEVIRWVPWPACACRPWCSNTSAPWAFGNRPQQVLETWTVPCLMPHSRLRMASK